MDQHITLFFNGSHSLYLDGIAWNATQTWVWLPLFLVILYTLFREHDLRHFVFLIALLLVCVLIADQVASSLFKPWIARWRPTHNPYIAQWVDIVNGYRGGLYGFFSSHAANTATLATFLALLFRNHRTTFTLYTWVLLNCWTRIYLGVHYFGDLLVGFLFGILIGTLAYRCYCGVFPHSHQHRYYAPLQDNITTIYLLTLILLAIPWRLYF